MDSFFGATQQTAIGLPLRRTLYAVEKCQYRLTVRQQVDALPSIAKPILNDDRVVFFMSYNPYQPYS